MKLPSILSAYLVCMLHLCPMMVFTQASLVVDPNPSTETQPSYPSNFIRVNNHVLFHASPNIFGQQWRTDGTSIDSSDLDILIREHIDLDGILIFSAATEETGTELWRTDGTKAGTWLIKDIEPGPYSSSPGGFFRFGSRIYFTSWTKQFGTELWVTEGDEQSTKMVIDLNPGTTSSFPGAFTAVGNELYFVSSRLKFRDYWKTDGTAAGTIRYRVEDTQDRVPAPRGFFGTGTDLYYFAQLDSVWGLWKTDGTTAGTRFIVSVPSGQEQIISWDSITNEVFFICGSPSHINGSAIWKSNGQPWNLQLVYDFREDPIFSFAHLNPNLTLFALLNSYWVSDGTRAGTKKLISSNKTQFFPGKWHVVGDQAFVNAGSELWVSDGSISNTRRIDKVSLRDIPVFFPIQITEYTDVDGKLIFAGRYAGEVEDIEPFVSDGTEEGTYRLSDMNQLPISSQISSIHTSDKQIFFTARNEMGTELWSSDGSRAGSDLLIDIEEGMGGSYPSDFIFYKGLLYFNATHQDTDSIWQRNLWQTDGTQAGTSLVDSVRTGINWYDYSQKTVWKDHLYFAGAAQDTGVRNIELWKSDGTPAGTHLLKDIFIPTGIRRHISSSQPNNFTPLNERLIFTARTEAEGSELWATDGTESGTFLLKDILPGSRGSVFHNTRFARIQDILLFTGRSYTHGHELWRTDGTAAGTYMVKDVFPGTNSSFLYSLGILNGAVIFTTASWVAGASLWITDGTEDGTRMFYDVVPNSRSGDVQVNPRFQAMMKDIVYLVINDSTHGQELWRTNGTMEGTQMVLDIVPGVEGGHPGGLIVLDGELYFTARDSNNPDQTLIWKSDGTAAGTEPIEENWEGEPFTRPRQLFVFQEELYFVADHPEKGESLFKIGPLKDIPRNEPGTSLFQVYPNPASDMIHLRLLFPELTKLDIQILDMKGRVVQQLSHDKASPLEVFSFQPKKLAAGLYFVRISTGKREMIQKIQLLQP